MTKHEVTVRGYSENANCIYQWAAWFNMPVDPNGHLGASFRGWYGDWYVIGAACETGWSLCIDCMAYDEPAARKLVTEQVTRLIPEVTVVTDRCIRQHS